MNDPHPVLAAIHSQRNRARSRGQTPVRVQLDPEAWKDLAGDETVEMGFGRNQPNRVLGLEVDVIWDMPRGIRWVEVLTVESVSADP